MAKIGEGINDLVQECILPELKNASITEDINHLRIASGLGIKIMISLGERKDFKQILNTQEYKNLEKMNGDILGLTASYSNHMLNRSNLKPSIDKLIQNYSKS